MALLLLLKLLSPVLLMVVQLRSSLPTRSMPAAGILLAATLVYSDLLSLLFFFSLRDSGSWLDIGMSIAHLIISLCSSCFFYVLFMVADWALTVTLYSTVTTAKHLSSA